MAEVRDAKGRFMPGHFQEASGIPQETTPPLPRKANPRTVLERGLLRDLAAEWEAGGAEAVRIMRIDKPAEFVKVCAALMPKEVTLDVANYVARVPVNVVDLDQWTELNQDLISHKP